MNSDIESMLREQTGTLSMGRPVGDVLSRGDRLRRRRTVIWVGAGAVAASAALAGSLALSAGGSSSGTPTVASLSGGATHLSPQELKALTAACLTDDMFTDTMSIPKGTLPLVADSVDGKTLAYFRDDDTEAYCVERERADGTFVQLQGDVNDYEPVPAGTALQSDKGFGYLDPGLQGGPVTDLWTTLAVSDEVKRVTARIGGRTYDADLVDGVALFWLEGDYVRRQVEDAVFTAYDDQGAVLQRVGGP